MKLSLSHPGVSPAGADNGVSVRTRALLLAGLVLGLTILGLVLWFAIAQPVKVLPRIAPLPPFALHDQYGLPLNSSDLRGRTALISFTYTGCGEECAAQRAGLIALREQLRADGRLGGEVILLTVSFDPERDTREALQIYAARLAADRESWRFATGEPGELKQLIGGELGLYYGKPDASGVIEHDQRVLLVDRNGEIRARYAVQDLRPERLERDLGLMEQELGSSGVMRQVYEASHLFLCYPD
jgi:protein SCO1/2